MYLRCLNLDNLKIIWSQPVNVVAGGMPVQTSSTQDLYVNEKDFVVKAVDGAYVLAKRTGLIKWKYRWRFAEEHENFAMIDSSLLFVSDGRYLKSYQMSTGKQNWMVKNARLYALHSKFVIASSIDKKWFLVIQKNSGKIINRIQRSDKSRGIRFIGDYVLVDAGNVTGVYK